MSDRNPLVNPRAGDKITSNGVCRTIIYLTVYGKVFYANPAGSRKSIDLNGYRKWAKEGVAEPGAHPGWSTRKTKLGNEILAEAQKICDHFAANATHPTFDLVIETLLEFGVAVATSNANGQEKIYAALRKKLKNG